MELRKGYKNTEVGVIPEDWGVEELHNVCERISVGLATSVTKYYKNIGIPIVRNLNIKDGYFDDSDMLYIEEQFAKKNSSKAAKVNDVLTVHTGSNIGLTCVLPENYNNCQTFTTLITTTKKWKLNPHFLSYHMGSSSGKSEILRLMVGGGKGNLNTGDLKKYKITIPPTTDEQTAIATALSDADALINSLEKLIAKKRNIKQGAMQKLLQPKAGWEIKKLGSIGKPYGGLSGKSKIDFADGKFPYIPFMNIMSNPIIDISYVGYVNIGIDENQNRALKGDLFFNGSSETPEEVGMCSILLEDIPNLYLNSFCFGFRLHKDSQENGLYLSYYFRSSEGRKLFYSMAQGATRYNLSKGNFNKLELSVPKSEEQSHIATIISDIDAEITALETKLDKYRKVKLGMMQNLLTGRIRLI